jgi:hypothetical protein
MHRRSRMGAAMYDRRGTADAALEVGTVVVEP